MLGSKIFKSEIKKWFRFFVLGIISKQRIDFFIFEK